ncbi:tape measure protein [Anaerotruncus colihominis]|uniref:Phage-related minor tail protein n=1 Tax=Anaerotruncus colihominis TaxID=169435 RepID=A0A174ULD6_9FIRM|nr:tape measure protein [Anaerotruncus colihominis]MCQ4735329.1 tape measure protein [Anaerotruncus colihominis]CUQ20590.1 Phage-related minor tail protein [Anaerotruncus colihominis]
MASIRSQLVLVDRMTAPLRSIQRAMNLALNSFESMQAASGRVIDTRSFQRAREELARLGAQLDELEEQARQAGGAAGGAADAMQSKFMRAAAVIGAAFSVKNIIGLADAMTQTQARLNLITGDLEKTAALQDQIMASANRSRASYQSTADAVAKMGIMAKDAFSSTDELVAFTELINKQFTIAGASAAGQEAAMLQLTQAMASGVLRGEELNSIFEQAPTIIQTIADYLGVPIGQIRQMASEGQITAEVVKSAMLASADEINAQFEAMPYTFAQVWTMIQNTLLQAFEPLIQAIGAGAQWIYDNWSTIEPVLAGVGAAVLVVAAALGIMTVKQWLLNSALLANPLLWVAVLIGVLVGALYKAVQAVGGLKNAWEIFKLIVVTRWNEIKLAFFTGVYWVIDLVDKLVLCWQKARVAVAKFMMNMKVAVLTILQSMINSAIDLINGFIGLLNKIPGVNIEAVEHVTFATTAAIENVAAQQALDKDLAAYEQELADAKAGRDAHLASLQDEVDDSASALRAAIEQGRSEAAANSASEQTAAAGIGADTSNIAESAGSAASSLKGTTEDLKYMRDIAEQEAINRFTTAEVKIDMTGMTNRIDSNMDLDGVLNTFTEGFAEALEVAAEGVHA